MEDCDEVTKWKTIAAAFHSGALDHCESFASTEDALIHLYEYRQHQERRRMSASDVEMILSPRREHRDFYYHPDNVAGSVGLSKFFKNKTEANFCLLCEGITMSLTKLGTVKFSNAEGSASSQLVPESELNLRRLEHLALMHTPFFVMLFLDLVQNRRCGFHQNKRARDILASYVFLQLKKDGASDTAEGSFDSYGFLKQWWRFQDRRSSRELNTAIPFYLELHTETSTWNPRMDVFTSRRPEPLYGFLTKRCLCHRLQPDADDVFSYPTDDLGAQWSTTLKTLVEGNVSTFSLGFLIHRSHLEDGLQFAVRACKDREATWGLPAECSSQMEPRLNCLVLEDVDHTQALMMHVITTLSSHWQSLTSWMESLRGRALDVALAFSINKVFLGIMGSLRDMCLQNKRPHRNLYNENPNCRESKLARAFFVHSETRDVLSLLPFVSLPRMCRSSNTPQDEHSFRNACATLATCLLHSHVQNDKAVLEKHEELERWWLWTTDGEPSTQSAAKSEQGQSNARSWWRDRASVELNAWRFCKSGLVNEGMWEKLKPWEAGERCESVVDLPSGNEWLGKSSRGLEAMRNRLLALGFSDPLRPISIIECLRKEELSTVQKKQWGITVPRPLGFIQDLLSCAAVMSKRGGKAPKTHWTEFALASAAPSSSRHSKHKRNSPPCVAHEVAVKKRHDEHDVEKALKHLQNLSRATMADHNVESIDQPRRKQFRGALTADSNTEIAVQHLRDLSTEVAEKLASTSSSPSSSSEIYYHTTKLLDKGELEVSGSQASGSKNEGPGFVNLQVLAETAVYLDQLNYSLNNLNKEAGTGDKKQEDSSLQQNQQSKALDKSGLPSETFIDHFHASSENEIEISDPKDQIMGSSQATSRQLSPQSADQDVTPVLLEQANSQGALVQDQQQLRPMCHRDAKHDSLLDKSWPIVAMGNRIRLQPNRHEEGDQERREEGDGEPNVILDAHLQRVQQDGVQEEQEGGEEEREPNADEEAFLKRSNRWKSTGFSVSDLEKIGYSPYYKMSYIAKNSALVSRLKNKFIEHRYTSRPPVINPSAGLVEPCWPCDTENRLDEDSEKANKNHGRRKKFLTWLMGVETKSCHYSILSHYPKPLKGKRFEISSQTLSCRHNPQSYVMVNLATPPENGFRHVELIVSEYPILAKENSQNLLVIRSNETMFLGAVCTIQNLNGLLVRKVFSQDVRMLEDILAMHTSLQVHPFVPRTFTLQLMKTPFAHKSGAGMFVGEAAGDWNIAQAYENTKFADMTVRDKVTLTYHLMQCLLRTQILSLRVLGFTMKIIQPARIWRWGAGFRLDFVSCLVDTMYSWKETDKAMPGGAKGLAVIYNTLEQLNLLPCVPTLTLNAMLKDMSCPDTNAQKPGSSLDLGAESKPSDEHLLHNVYNTCSFKTGPTSVESSLETILGPGRYESFELSTEGLVCSPQGPFYIRMQNQCFKWNKAMVVEPVLKRKGGTCSGGGCP